MQLNARHITEKVMPAIARIEKMTVRGTATVTSCSMGIPSCGIIPPRMQEGRKGGRERGREGGREGGLISSAPILIEHALVHTYTHTTYYLATNYLPFQEGRQTGSPDSLPVHYLSPPVEVPHLYVQTDLCCTTPVFLMSLAFTELL